MNTHVRSGQNQRVHANSLPSDADSSTEFRAAAKSDFPTQRDSADQHDDTSEARSKGNRAKPSDTLRRSQACLACRRRKLRCDAKKPTCTRCERAWLAYQPAADAAGSSQAGPPPCEYDISLLSKIFKQSSSNDATKVTNSQPSALHYQDNVKEEQLVKENEQLRAQISHLQGKLRRDEDDSSPPSTRDRAAMRAYPQSDGSTLSAASRLSVASLTDTRYGETSSLKRVKSSHDSDSTRNRAQNTIGVRVLQPLSDGLNRDKEMNSAPQLFASSSTDDPGQPCTAAKHSWSVTGSTSAWTAPRNYRNEASARSPVEVSSTTQINWPPLPGRQALDQIIETCRHESWLFAAINGYVLRDVAALLETGPNAENAESDQLTARALMLATVAIGLPLFASSSPKAIGSSPAFKNIDGLIRSQLQSNLARLDSQAWISAVTKIYADGARDLLNHSQARSAGLTTRATFVVRMLLVEYSHAHCSSQVAQADLSLAASEARLLHLHSAVSGTHPRFSAGSTRSSSSNLGRALRGLMQSQTESIGFWSLFLHDCFQSRLSSLPVTLERQSIRVCFPQRVEVDSSSPAQQNLNQVEAYMHRRRGLPSLEPSDNTMSILVKVALVLDQCCEHANTVRQSPPNTSGAEKRDAAALQQERDGEFTAAHESIRNSRTMLSHFDDGRISRSDVHSSGANSGRLRESLIATLVLHDQMRFAAEVAHHLAVLSLFETIIKVDDPFTRAPGMVCDASVWLSRLAGMALQSMPLLYALPSFCSSAFFVAARWFLFLQHTDPDHFHADISTMVLLLSTRGEGYSRDQLLAKAVVALKRECDFYGRICTSPFTWPIDAISEFVPLSRRDTSGRPPPTQGVESSFVSIATLAASVEHSAVIELAHAPTAI